MAVQWQGRTPPSPLIRVGQFAGCGRVSWPLALPCPAAEHRGRIGRITVMHHNLIGMLPDDVARQLAEDLRPRDAYSIEAAARRLSVSTRFAEQLIERGELRAFRVGRRTLVSRRALDDFIELHEASAR